MKALSFLLNRPIGVSLFFLAFVLLGLVSALKIPIALLPDIPVGTITIKTEAEGYSARKLEDEIASYIRFQMLQVSKVEGIESRSYDGINITRLSFPFGSDMEMALFEVNEQLDRVLNLLPRSLPRPIVMQTDIADIPVFYLNLTIEGETDFTNVEFNRFAHDVVRRRLEQLPGIAFVDISGVVEEEIAIIPDREKMRQLNIDYKEIENTIQESLIYPFTVQLTKNKLEYTLAFPAILKGAEDIEQLYIKRDSRNIPLRNFAQVKLQQKPAQGYCISNGEQAISMAIIGQDGSRLDQLKTDVNQVVKEIQSRYPQMAFEIINDQSELLVTTISNLVITLLIGTVLAIVMVLLFLGSRRLPFIIGLSIPVSLLISLMFFRLLGLSINIVSLSGLILGIGMMIDNSIIVVDNISRKYLETNNLTSAVIKAPIEVFPPLLSSVLTTTGIFIPLIFLSGLSGALFYDQAIAIATGLFVSLAVSIILIPLYYKILKPANVDRKTIFNSLFYRFYEHGFTVVYKHQITAAIVAIVLIVAGYFSIVGIRKEKMPPLTRLNNMIHIDWNQEISAKENSRRAIELSGVVKDLYEQQVIWAGRQQYYLQHLAEQSIREARVYQKFKTPAARDSATSRLAWWMAKNYPAAVMTYEIVPNLFDYIFEDDEPDLELRFYYDHPDMGTYYIFEPLLDSLERSIFPVRTRALPTQEQIGFVMDPSRMRLLDINRESLAAELSNQLQPAKIASLARGAQLQDITFRNRHPFTIDWANEVFLNNSENRRIPLSRLGDETRYLNYTSIYANRQGEYIPAEIMKGEITDPNHIIERAKSVVNNHSGWNVEATGEMINKNKLALEMGLVMAVSVILLYFILAAQFESLIQPLIILLEIPMDIIGVTLMLFLFGSSINIMSMIGIIVMAGIAINDSILKVDTINLLRKEGMSLDEAIHKAGQIRLRPIIMTSLTTICALVPFLFVGGIGNEIQKPLALAIIGGLGLGTIVSLLYVPFFYRWTYLLGDYLKVQFSKK